MIYKNRFIKPIMSLIMKFMTFTTASNHPNGFQFDDSAGGVIVNAVLLKVFIEGTFISSLNVVP